MSTENLTEKSRIVRDARRRLGLTQAQLAEKLKVSPNYLYQIESGRRSPSAGLLALLATLEHDTAGYVVTHNVIAGGIAREPVEKVHQQPEQLLGHFGDLVLGDAIANATKAGDWDSVAVIGAELASRKLKAQKEKFRYPNTKAATL